MPKYLDLKPGKRIVVEVRGVDPYEHQKMSSALIICGYDHAVAVRKVTGKRYTRYDLYRDFPIGSLVVLEATTKFDQVLGERLTKTGDHEALEHNLHRYYKLVKK